jgi:hypothetical protein
MSIPKDIGLDHIQASIFSLLNQPFPHLDTKKQEEALTSQYYTPRFEHMLQKPSKLNFLATNSISTPNHRSAQQQKKSQKWRTTVAKKRQHFRKNLNFLISVNILLFVACRKTEKRKTASKKLPLEGKTMQIVNIASGNCRTATNQPKPSLERGKRRHFEECSYIRGAPGVVYGSGEENPPLPVDQQRLLVVGHRALDGGGQRCRRHRAAQQGSRPPPRHHSLPRSKEMVEEEDHAH